MCGIREPNTLSNISQVKTTHLHLDWTISFEKKILSGHVVLDLITLVDNVDKVVLDTSFLDVTKASYEGNDVKVGFQEIFVP
jgi:leukotriene-A4 hydrolase